MPFDTNVRSTYNKVIIYRDRCDFAIWLFFGLSPRYGLACHVRLDLRNSEHGIRIVALCVTLTLFHGVLALYGMQARALQGD